MATTPSAAGDDAEESERARFVGDRSVHNLGERDIDRIAGRMWLVVRDVELTDAEGEVDRVEIFERRREVRQVQREKGERAITNDRRARGARGEDIFSARTADRCVSTSVLRPVAGTVPR